ncbi:MAG TPA: hypothetical protein ENL03_06355 [Phycisphaerae bacterium]|nr:hypothetical protein [Phycisphaerae bacterium]
MTEAPKSKKGFKIGIWIGCSVILIGAIHIPFCCSSGDVVYQWQQPKDVTYDRGGGFYLWIIESDMDLGILEFRHNYKICVGRIAKGSIYGHYIKYPFSAPSPKDFKESLSDAEVIWTPEGVELSLPSGHHIFIPADAFTGGR